MIGVSAHDAVNYDGYSAWWIWMLEHGLDGIVGGLLAVAGVAATLWFDRRSRRDERKDSERDEAEAVVRQILILAVDVDEAVTQNVVGWIRISEKMRSLAREIKISEPVLHRVPAIGRSLLMLGAIANQIADDGPRAREHAGMVVTSVSRRCSNWLRDPDSYSSESMDKAERLAHGRTVIDDYLKLDSSPESSGPTES